MPYTDDDLLNPEKQDELDLAALVAAEPEPVAAPVGPQDGLARLAELIAARQAQPDGPGAAEREYLAQNKPQAGWKNVLGAVGSAIAESTGTSGAIDRFHKTQQMAEQRRREGLEAARSIDLGRRPVDRSTAELGVMAGMSPEASAAMTQDSPGLKLLNSGMGQLGARYLQLSQQAQKAAADREAKGTLQEDRQQHQLSLEEKRLAGRKELKAMGKGGGAGGGGGGPAMTPEQKAERVAVYVSGQANVPEEQVKAVMAGNVDGIPAEAQAAIRRHLVAFQANPPKEQARMLKDMSKSEAGSGDRLRDNVEMKRRDPNKLVEYRREVANSGAAIADAAKAWQEMTPEGKQAMAQLSGESWLSGTLRDARMSPEDQARASRIQALANQIIKATSGAAVSDSEWTRIAREMGLAGRNFDALKSPDAIGSWIQNAKAGWVRNKRAIESEFDLKGGAGGR